MPESPLLGNLAKAEQWDLDFALPQFDSAMEKTTFLVIFPSPHQHVVLLIAQRTLPRRFYYVSKRSNVYFCQEGRVRIRLFGKHYHGIPFMIRTQEAQAT